MFTLNCKGRLLVIDRPVVMGIINVTPDSFYAGSRQESLGAVVDMAGKMLEDGAAILDIGGQSSRPGSIALESSEEADRVVPAIAAVKAAFPEAIISIDTWSARVAADAIRTGASIVNDISAGAFDPALWNVVSQEKVPYVLMHMRGTPQTMQQHTSYENLTLEVLDFFINKIGACRAAGIGDIIIDPGFGFAKTIAQNFELLDQLDRLCITGLPVLAGLSRKGTIYKTLGIAAEQAGNGTTVLNTIALMKGACILRVHDVREAVEAITLVEALRKDKGTRERMPSS